MTYEFHGEEYEDDTMVDLGGGMVVRLAELMDDDLDLRSHELPRNSGEDAAVNGPTSLTGGDEAEAPA